MFGCAKLTFMIPAGPQEIQSISFAVSKWGLFKKLIFFCSISTPQQWWLEVMFLVCLFVYLVSRARGKKNQKFVLSLMRFKFGPWPKE